MKNLLPSKPLLAVVVVVLLQSALRTSALGAQLLSAARCRQLSQSADGTINACITQFGDAHLSCGAPCRPSEEPLQWNQPGQCLGCLNYFGNAFCHWSPPPPASRLLIILKKPEKKIIILLLSLSTSFPSSKGQAGAPGLVSDVSESCPPGEFITGISVASGVATVTCEAATPPPTAAPTASPTTSPTETPTTGPTLAPTAAPTSSVTATPTEECSPFIYSPNIPTFGTSGPGGSFDGTAVWFDGTGFDIDISIGLFDDGNNAVQPTLTTCDVTLPQYCAIAFPSTTPVACLAIPAGVASIVFTYVQSPSFYTTLLALEGIGGSAANRAPITYTFAPQYSPYGGFPGISVVNGGGVSTVTFAGSPNANSGVAGYSIASAGGQLTMTYTGSSAAPAFKMIPILDNT